MLCPNSNNKTGQNSKKINHFRAQETKGIQKIEKYLFKKHY